MLHWRLRRCRPHLGIVIQFLALSTCLGSYEHSATCAADGKVKPLGFVPILPLKCRKVLHCVCSAEDRPAEVARIRSAARETMNSLLGAVFEKASQRPKEKSSDAALNDDQNLSAQKIRVGFVGTGTITSAVVTGLLSSNGSCDLRVTVSPRNKQKAASLKEKFDQVVIAKDNQEVLDESDIVCIAVTPATAGDVLASLKFRPEHHVVSFMSTVSLDRLRAMVSPATSTSRAIPMPPMARGLGPCALYPSTPAVSSLLGRAAAVVSLNSEEELAVLMSTSSLMAPFYQQLETIAQWMASRGVPPPAASRYVATLFHALAADALEADAAGAPGAGFAEITADSQTPGGLNEQSLRQLTAAGYYDKLPAQLDVILARVRGGAAAPPAGAGAGGAAAPPSPAVE